jgi:hypothetical protein
MTFWESMDMLASSSRGRQERVARLGRRTARLAVDE